MRILFGVAKRYAQLSCSDGPVQLRTYPSALCRGNQTLPLGANVTLQVLARTGLAVRNGPS